MNIRTQLFGIGLSTLFVLGLAAWLPAPQAQPTCSLPDQHISVPLTDLGASFYVRPDGVRTTFTGGLYPGGQNVRPPEHEAAGLALAQQIAPLDPQGQPDPQDGKIVLASIGMSNASMEFGALIGLARDDPQIDPHVVLINTALTNRTAETWADPQGEPWRETARRLAERDLSPQQVQVVWLKQVHRGPGTFPQKAQTLQADLEAIARNLHAVFPNLKIVFVSSRTRSYRYERGLSPEPAAFESGFAVKWMIEKQIAGDPTLNFDPARGEVAAPYLTWGPYLWIDGLTPRQDGQVWPPSDLRPDCTHPSQAGADKVAGMLLDFLKTDTLARGWFLAAEARPGPALQASETPAEPPIPAPTAVIAAGAAPVDSPVPSLTPVTAANLASDTPPPAATPPAATPEKPPLPVRSLAPLGLAFIILLAVLLGLGGLILLRGRKR